MDKKLFMEFANENKKLVTIAGSAMIISIIAGLFTDGATLTIAFLLFVLIYYKYNKFVTKKKEDERLEQKRLEEEKKEAEKKAKLEAFHNSVDIDTELVSILAVLENSKAVSTANFEKGVAQLLEKNEIQFSAVSVLADFKKALFTKAFVGKDDVAKILAMEYFKRDVIYLGLANKVYFNYKLLGKDGTLFVKALYGIAGHAMNYKNKGNNKSNYQPITAADFIEIIENSDILKSHTDKDPFKVEETRKEWANDLCSAPFKLIESSGLNEIFEKEEVIDEALYLTYVFICQDERNGHSEEKDCVDEIAETYLNYCEKHLLHH